MGRVADVRRAQRLDLEPKPSINAAEAAVMAIAAGEWDERTTANWLRTHPTEISDA